MFSGVYIELYFDFLCWDFMMIMTYLSLVLFWKGDAAMSDFLQKKDYCSGSCVLLLPEKLVIPHSRDFEKELQQSFEKRIKTIFLDCKNLKKCDTTGLSYIISYQKKLKDRGGELRLINVADSHIKQVFRAIQLNKTVNIDEIEEV